SLFFSLMLPLPPSSTLFPYTTLFRSPLLAFLCGLQDTLELAVYSLPSLGRVPLRPAGKLDGRVRRSVSPDPVQAGNQHSDGLARSEEHTSELQSLRHLVCRLLLEKKK